MFPSIDANVLENDNVLCTTSERYSLGKYTLKVDDTSKK